MKTVWLREDVAAGAASDAMLVAGFPRRSLFLSHAGDRTAGVRVETDADGTGDWQAVQTIDVPAGEGVWRPLPAGGEWLRLVAEAALPGVTAQFDLAQADTREERPLEDDRVAAEMTAGIASAGHGEEGVVFGPVRARGGNERTLSFAATTASGPAGYYELDGDLRLRRVDDAAADAFTRANAAVPRDVLVEDDASVLYVDDAGARWRLPRAPGAAPYDHPLGPHRVAREVATERDLFLAGGTFYELPAENAGGFAKVRPVCSHRLRPSDFCSYRGMLVISGLDAAAARAGQGGHVVVSDDGQAALWLGAVDDLWRLGRPRGDGGPWKDTPVAADEPSDPYLLTGYDKRTITLSHDQPQAVNVRVEIDVRGDGQWATFRTLAVPAGEQTAVAIPEEVRGYWLRCVSDTEGRLTAQCRYR